MRTTPVAILALAPIMFAGCSTAPPPRTPGMEAIGVDVTTTELRQKIYQYESVFAQRIHRAADEVFNTESDPRIREMSIRWKINAVPTMQSAVFQLDPLAGLADAWGLTVQMERFFTTGNGKDLFGASQPIAVQASRDLHEEARALALSVVGEEKLREVEPKLRAWLEENPILDITFGRRTLATDAAAVTAAEWGGGGLQSVGQIEELVRDISDRLAIYGAQLPELARSHAELVVIETDRYILSELWDRLEDLESTAKSIGGDVHNLTEFVDDTPNLIEKERTAIIAALQQELEAALADVDRQRIATLDTIAGERKTILTDVDNLRAVMTEDLKTVRVDATTDLEALVERQAQAFVAEAEGLVDRVFWRLLILVAVGLVGLAIVLRLTRAPKSA